MHLDPAILRALSLFPSSTSVHPHGGSGYTTTAKITTPSKIYFLKTGRGKDAEIMFRGEHASLNAIHTVVPSLCPQSFATGKLDEGDGSFLVTDFLDMGGKITSSTTTQKGENQKKKTGSPLSLAQKLATLHSTPAPLPQNHSTPVFGFPVPTCCGDTAQENQPYTSSWAHFYAHNRLLAILKKSERTNGKDEGVRGMVERVVKEVVPRLIGDGHLNGGEGVVPVVCHGDLWGGNWGRGVLGEGGGEGEVEEVVFDPSAVWGHNEYELGIMQMFAGFPRNFLYEYHKLCPKTEPVAEYEDRIKLYELYHHLNHFAIFGGGYKSGAVGIMRELLRKYGNTGGGAGEGEE